MLWVIWFGGRIRSGFKEDFRISNVLIEKCVGDQADWSSISHHKNQIDVFESWHRSSLQLQNRFWSACSKVEPSSILSTLSITYRLHPPHWSYRQCWSLQLCWTYRRTIVSIQSPKYSIACSNITHWSNRLTQQKPLERHSKCHHFQHKTTVING